MQGREGGGVVAPNDKCRKPQTVEKDFKEANEKRERWRTQAGITCQNTEQAEAVWGYTFLGFNTKPNALKLCQGDTCMLKSTYKDCTVHHPHRISQSHLLKPAGLCLWCIIKKTVGRCWCVATPWPVLWLILMILAPGCVKRLAWWCAPQKNWSKSRKMKCED